MNKVQNSTEQEIVFSPTKKLSFYMTHGHLRIAIESVDRGGGQLGLNSILIEFLHRFS